MIPSLLKYKDYRVLPKDSYQRLAILILIYAFLYTCVRAFILSITHDEALTLFWHVPGSVTAIFLYSTPGLPDNNHLLHTLLVKLTTTLFGTSEFVLRLPSLAGCALYLLGSYRSLSLITRGRGLVIGALLLSLHPYLIDYFSVARGYSLGLGFSMLGLYFLLFWARNPRTIFKSPSAKTATLMFALAVISNLTFLVLYAGGILLFFILEIYLFRKEIIEKGDAGSLFKNFTLSFARFLSYSLPLVIVTSAVPILKIMKENLFTIGGSKGFWQDTVYSLIKQSLYGKQYIAHMDMIAHVFIAFILIAAVTSLVYKIIAGKEKKNSRIAGSLLCLLLLCAFISIIQHHLLGTAYLTGRRAIFFIPIFLLLFISISHGGFRADKINRLFSSSMHGLSIVLILFFLSCTNVSSVHDWRYDASTKSMMTDLQKYATSKELSSESKSMGITWRFEPSINYYISRNKMDWLKRVNRKGADGLYDYYYLQRCDQEIVDQYQLEVLKEYNPSRTCLARLSGHLQ